MRKMNIQNVLQKDSTIQSILKLTSEKFQIKGTYSNMINSYWHVNK